MRSPSKATALRGPRGFLVPVLLELLEQFCVKFDRTAVYCCPTSKQIIAFSPLLYVHLLYALASSFPNLQGVSFAVHIIFSLPARWARQQAAPIKGRRALHPDLPPKPPNVFQRTLLRSTTRARYRNVPCHPLHRSAPRRSRRTSSLRTCGRAAMT
jgi:hypothetical protein